MAGSVAIVNFGKGSIDGGVVDALLRGLQADKETAFQTPELGAGSAYASASAQDTAPPVAESTAANIAGGVASGGSDSSSSSSSESSSSSSGDARAYPTTMGASKGAQDMGFAGEVALGRMGGIAPDASPGIGGGKGASVGM